MQTIVIGGGGYLGFNLTKSFQNKHNVITVVSKENKRVRTNLEDGINSILTSLIRVNRPKVFILQGQQE